MKIKILAFFALLMVFVFSGCGIAGKPDGGVYKSTDAGATFEQKVKITEEENFGGANVLSLALDPNNPDIIYAGTEKLGVFRTTDGGESWTADINKFQQVFQILVNYLDSQTIYITAVKDGRGKILKTVNGGEKWDEVFTEKSSGPLILSMAMDPFNPDILYAGDSQGGIYKSEDAGASWRSLLWAKSSVRKISIDSGDPNLIYFGTTGSGALVTRDGGENFENIISNGYIFNIQAHPSKSEIVFLSNREGLQKSVDGGKTWEKLNTLVKPKKLGSRGFAINPDNDNEILFASGHAFYKTTNGGKTWTPVQFDISRNIEVIKINPQNTNIIYLGANKKSSGGLFKLFPF